MEEIVRGGRGVGGNRRVMGADPGGLDEPRMSAVPACTSLNLLVCDLPVHLPHRSAQAVE